MEACCRHLREGAVKDEAGCALVVLCDDLGCVGDTQLLHRLCEDYLQALAQQRAQASRVTLLQLDGSMPARLLRQQRPGVACSVQVLDGCTDPDGWLSENLPSRAPFPSSDSQPPPTHECISTGSLDALFERLTSSSYTSTSGAASAQTPSPSAPPHNLCVIIDSLTPLLLRHPLPKVLLLLEQLRAHPHVSCVLTALHKDAHSEHAVSGIQHAASCYVEPRPVGGLHAEVVARSLAHAHHQRVEAQADSNVSGEGLQGQAAGTVPHGCVEFLYKARRGGRMRSESAFYAVLPNGGVSVFAPPPELAALMMPDALVGMLTRIRADKAAAAQEKQHQHQQKQQPQKASKPELQQQALPAAGGMRLELSKEEREARDAVVLPYEHQGHGKQYQTADWRDYLPPTAGGWNPESAQHARHMARSHAQGAAQSKQGAASASQQSEVASGEALGRILYVRDSDDGVASDGGLLDSDEDPDDDLDI